MNTYRVWARYTTNVFVEIEAENEQEAYDIAKETDGGSFIEGNDGDDWSLDSVDLIKSDKETR